MIDTTIPPEWKRQWDELLVHMHDPFKLRVTVLSVVAALGLLGIYRPMSSELALLRRQAKAAEDRVAKIREIEQLRGARVKLLENLPEQGDINFWTEYFLGGIRESAVNLRKLESRQLKLKIGNKQVVYLDLEIVGTYDQIHQLITWIEENKYFTRIIKMRFKAELKQIEGKLTTAVLVNIDRPSTREKTHGS